MDELTQNYYASQAIGIADRYDSIPSPMERMIRRVFGEGMRILDIGAGSGRDVRYLRRVGCDAYGVEPCTEVRLAALQRHPELYGRLGSESLPGLGQPFGGQFDGVLCSAVLQHLPRAAVLDAAIAMRNVLKENGYLLLSVPAKRPGLDESDRDEHGRLFTPFHPDYLQLLFERIGFVLLERWESPDGFDRAGHSWCNFLLQARNPGGTRPLDQIEGILNRDRKTATYKLALFRALSEIAMTSFEQVHWLNDGVVGIPLAAVSEKWLLYYWPIFESSVFIPQIRGEAPNCQMPVAFRSSLSRLIERYKYGGMTRFVLEQRGGKLSAEVASLLSTVHREIQNTIVSGPVTYAGGALETDRLFQFDRRTQDILVSAAIWRELSLVGHWIQDAVILRWAELTRDIARQALKASEMIDLLLTVPIPERDVADARRAYHNAHVTECTWSGAKIQRGFDVDHVLPFSLWHNNDLWNLVPAAHRVNVAKRHRLPTRDLILARRDWIIGYWSILRSQGPLRFDYEASRLAGLTSLPANWEGVVFRCVSEAVEFTASQRGCERWQP
jgi:SAM-dependent methyltransferase